jgi:hypothetical protein
MKEKPETKAKDPPTTRKWFYVVDQNIRFLTGIGTFSKNPDCGFPFYSEHEAMMMLEYLAERAGQYNLDKFLALTIEPFIDSTP